MLYVCLKVIEENGTRGKRFLWKSSTTIQNVLSSGHTLELCKIYQAYNIEIKNAPECIVELYKHAGIFSCYARRLFKANW